jgi:hypothetical protein
MGALGKQGHEDHQVRQSEKPIVGVSAGRFRGAGYEAEVAALRKIVEMLDANARQGRHF